MCQMVREACEAAQALPRRAPHHEGAGVENPLRNSQDGLSTSRNPSPCEHDGYDRPSRRLTPFDSEHVNGLEEALETAGANVRDMQAIPDAILNGA